MAEIEAHESKIYSEFAPLYDKIFGKIFYSRLERVIEDLEIPPGAKVLEVGAGYVGPRQAKDRGSWLDPSQSDGDERPEP